MNIIDDLQSLEYNNMVGKIGKAMYKSIRLRGATNIQVVDAWTEFASVGGLNDRIRQGLSVGLKNNV